ncbi:MAG TPA: UDP-N-acetylmuramoyl-tripeptide--D-alanyl-D-alanine ligase [Verrucomicrobiales bacterium]|nr:UDP-N-acetylmuramoylalanyl-D-glutamate--2,6-diaminopimelate ligase [Verrucomicrobiales bacterium]HBE97505.1 UDP-N-acetylmuramoyl-tripeptide--D-alanyl-D-alanine ligase [Verrucomicrobiales bacterium]
MNEYSVQQLASAMNGFLQQGRGDFIVTCGVSTDTRSIQKGSLFVALRGENFDAHNFLRQAVEGGAGALLVQNGDNLPEGVPVILVDDTLAGLQRLAEWYRGELSLPVVAISGSNGKTSTKDFARSVLSQKLKVNATQGNLNNHIGLPLTILATQGDDEAGIFEMGMNHSGELKQLCEIGRPDISIITNVGTAHIEHLGSREAIAIEKGALARALNSEGILLVPADCDFVEQYREETEGKIIAVGGDDSPVRAEDVVLGANGSQFELIIEGLGRIATSISVPGRHMVSNALLAAGAGWLLGLSLEEISAGLSEAGLTSGRLRQFDCRGISVIDDTYNANPESVIAALETLASLPGSGRRIAALGIMAELGSYAEVAYQRVGRLAAERDLCLVAVGDDAVGMSDGAREAGGEAHQFSKPESASEWLSANTHSGDLVLFKGSRMAAMERVMNQSFPS